MSTDISGTFTGQITFLPHILLIATWVDVGYFNMRNDKVVMWQSNYSYAKLISIIILKLTIHNLHAHRSIHFSVCLPQTVHPLFSCSWYEEGGIQWTTGDENKGKNGSWLAIEHYQDVHHTRFLIMLTYYY